MKAFKAFAVGVFVFPVLALASGGPQLKVYLSDKLLGTFSLSELKKAVPANKITYYDPQFKKKKTYEAFPIRGLLYHLYGPTWERSEYSDLIFTSADGVSSIARKEKFNDQGGYLAYRDIDTPSNPAHFYLFWTGENQSSANEFPWPGQLEQIKLVKFEDQYPKVVPAGVSEDSSEYHGFLLFKGQCFRCHSINQQGGKIGPDLNAPQSIADYRSENMIKAFIKEPSKYRYTTMPDHSHLTDRELDSLVSYFKLKSKQPK